MRIRYDERTDTGYIYLRDDEEPRPKVDEAEEVAPGVIVDFDEEDKPVGIEIYDGARTKLAGAPLPRLEDERALEIGRIWLAGYRAGWETRDANTGKIVEVVQTAPTGTGPAARDPGDVTGQRD